MSDECKHGYDYQEHCQRYHVIGCREGCFEELKDATNMLGGISDCKYLVKGEEKMSERLFLEEMKPNPDECKDRLILDTILMKFLSRKVSRLEDEIRYLRRHNNKKNRTIKRLKKELKTRCLECMWNKSLKEEIAKDSNIYRWRDISPASVVVKEGS